MPSTELLRLIGFDIVCGAIAIECIGLLCTRWMQLYRAFRIIAIGVLLEVAGIAMVIAARMLA